MSQKKAKQVYSNIQKKQILSEHFEHGLSISAIFRKHQINAVTLYKWKKMFTGPDKKKSSPEDPLEIERLKQENEALKQVVAGLAVG